jgi:DNA polymerase
MRMLELLDKMIGQCTDCELYTGGRVKPYWTPMSILAALGEAPGKEEVEQNEPFVGKAGEILGSNMAKSGFRKDQFLIINSVNCRPVDGGANGKPKMSQIAECKKWVNKYIKVVKPEKMIAFGNYARGSLNGSYTGIVKYNGWVDTISEYGIYALYSVHPAYCIYQGKEGEEMLKKSINKFRDLRLKY